MSPKPNTIPIRKLRELELVLLFCFDFHDEMPQNELVDLITKELKVGKKYVQEALDKVLKLREHLFEIDAIIGKVSTSYDVQRINYVERAILRLALFELHMAKTLSPPIVIAEAKRLARKFSTKEAAAFCQALVDATIKKSS
jgi:N utilization substance protein B